MKKKSARIIAVLALSLVVILRFGYRYMRQVERQEQAKQVEQAKAVSEETKKQDNTAAIKSIVGSINKASNQKTTYDKYVPVDGTYSLGIKDNKYYIVDVKTQQNTLLDNVTNAYVLYVKNEDNNSEFNGLFIQKDNNWYLINEKAEVMADLKGIDVTEKTEFVIKNNDISVAK